MYHEVVCIILITLCYCSSLLLSYHNAYIRSLLFVIAICHYYFCFFLSLFMIIMTKTVMMLLFNESTAGADASVEASYNVASKKKPGLQTLVATTRT